jgi:NAD(P)-dependent dehydrogenase (short-subunit alcohol dehydrogenase family)
MVLSLVTGGAGYFGGLLARQLLSLGQEVRILDLNRTDLRGVEQIIIGDHNVAQDDLAYGILLAIDAKAANRIYWLADERPYPIKEIVDTVREVLRDDFGVTVKPKTIQVPGIVSDLARLGDGMLQSLGFYNQEGNDSCGTAFEIASQTTIAVVADNAVIGALFDKAVGGDTAACIWWTKSKCGWKETQAVENRGVDYDRMSEE